MEPVDVRPSTYMDYSKEVNDEDPKFKICYVVRISKYKNIFAKGYVPNCSEELFVIEKLKSPCRGHMLLVILTEKNLLERFTKKTGIKQVKKSLELKKQ